MRHHLTGESLHGGSTAVRAARSRWHVLVMGLGISLPVPVLAASGLALPLPPIVERIAAALVSGAQDLAFELTAEHEAMRRIAIIPTPDEIAAASERLAVAGADTRGTVGATRLGATWPTTADRLRRAANENEPGGDDASRSPQEGSSPNPAPAGTPAGGGGDPGGGGSGGKPAAESDPASGDSTEDSKRAPADDPVKTDTDPSGGDDGSDELTKLVEVVETPILDTGSGDGDGSESGGDGSDELTKLVEVVETTILETADGAVEELVTVDDGLAIK